MDVRADPGGGQRVRLSALGGPVMLQGEITMHFTQPMLGAQAIGHTVYMALDTEP